MDAKRTSPSKKRKRLDSHGSLADVSDGGSADGNYTRDSHDIIVTKSRIYKKKQMKKLGSKSSAEISNTDSDGDGRVKEKKNKDNETSTVSEQSKNGNVVNGSSDITGNSKKTGVANNLPMSPTKSSVLLRRQYRRERTSSQSSTGTDHGNTSLSQIDYFPLSGLEKKNDTTEEERNADPKHTCSPQKSSAKRSSASGVFPWISSSQESDKDSQPPIRLDADGLLVQEDIFKKPLEPVKYCSGLVSKSGKRKKKRCEKVSMSDDTSGVETDTSTSASTVQSAQEDSESGNEKRRKKKKKKKKKKEKDKDIESSALENQVTSDSTIQSADDNTKESDEKRHKKKKKKKKKEENDQESNTSEGKAKIQPGEDNVEESDKKKHKKKRKKKDRDVEDTSDAQSSVSRIQTEDDNVEEGVEKRHKKKKKKKKNKDAESSTSEMQVSEAEDSDIIPPSQELSKPEKSKKKHKKKTNASEVNGEKVVPCSQDTTLNGNVSSESENASSTDTDSKKKKKKSKDKRSESAYTSQSESEVPESDVDPPVDSPLPLPRRHAIEHNEASKAGSKDKPKSTTNKLPVWCIEDAGQESQTVSEVFDLFGWGQNKPSSSDTRHSSLGLIRTPSAQPNFDRVVGKEGGTGVERRRKDTAFEYQSHDETGIGITPQKKSKLSRKGKQQSDKGKAVNDGEKQQQSIADNTSSAGNNAETHGDPMSSKSTKEDTAKEDSITKSVNDPSSKVPRKPAQDNITERRKGTKRVKKGDVSEEAAVDKEHAEKRKKTESAGKQQDSTEKQNSTEEVDKEVNPEEQAEDQATENRGDKGKLSKKRKQKSPKGKAVTDGEKQQQSSMDDSSENDAGTEQEGEPVASEGTREDTAKEDAFTESVDYSSSKVPSKPAQNNITERRKGTKRVKKGGVSEEAESSAGKKHAEKRGKIESAGKQEDTTEKQNPTEEVAEEVNPEETAQDQAREDPGDGDQDDHSSGDEFQEAVPSTSTGARSSSRVRAREARRRKSVVNSGDTEDLWLKGVQALSAEDVQRLREKGVTIKFGHFSRQEIAILKKNMESFCEIHGVEEPRTLLYPNQYEERKTLKKLIHEAGLFRHLAQGLDRPLWNVYTRARYMYSNAEVSGKWTPKEHKKLMQLYEQHGPRWALISKSLGRFEDNIKQRFRHTRRKSAMGRWSAKESRLLIQAVQAVTGKQDVTNVTSGISWQACSDFMNNVRNGRQCHNHWLYLVNWFFFQQGGPLLSPQQDIQLIDEIYKSEAEVESDIDWKALAGKFSWVKHQGHLRRRWHRLKLKVPDWNRKDMDEILDYLKADLKKKADSGTKPRVQREAKSGPFIFTSSEESSDDEDEDDDDTEEDDNNLDGTVGDDEPTSTSDKESSKEENTGQTSQDKKSDEESSDEEDDDTEEDNDIDGTVGDDKPTNTSVKESSKEENTGKTSQDKKSDEESSDEEDDDTEEDNDIDDTVGNDKPTNTSDKESPKGKDTGQITLDNKSDDESSEEDDTDDDSETEVDTSDEG